MSSGEIIRRAASLVGYADGGSGSSGGSALSGMRQLCKMDQC